MRADRSADDESRTLPLGSYIVGTMISSSQGKRFWLDERRSSL